MAISYDQVKDLKQGLETTYQKRHSDLALLRRYWHGEWWQVAGDANSPLSQVFRDWGQRQGDVGPDIKLVKNVVQEVCVKFQTYLSQLPQIRVYVDPPETDNKRRQATMKERYLYGCWSEGKMNRTVNNLGWYLPLMGDAYLGIYPDLERNLPMPLLRSPEYAWPVMSFDGMRENATMFIWKVKVAEAKRQFKSMRLYVPPDERFPGSRILGKLRKDKGEEDGTVEVLEYTDADQYVVFVDGRVEHGVEHELGVNLFDHVKFIDVPGEPFGHGAVEQAIGLNEMGNALYSMLFQAVMENVFPTMILEDPQKAPEEIERGPGAIIPLNAGGKAYHLSPPVQALPVQQQFLLQNERDIRQASSMGPTEFGQSPATSIVTGKAVDALLGAGSGSTVEMVQGSGLGPGLVMWNEKAIVLGQRFFRDQTMQLYGVHTPGPAELAGRRFGLTLKGSQLVGSTRNEVVFSVQMGAHEKLVMALQALGGGLVSKKWGREQIGVVDNAHMEEEILVEKVDEAVLGFMSAALQAAATPEQAEQVEEQAASFLAGDTGGAGHPLLAQGPNPVPPALPAPQAQTPGPAGPPGLSAQPAAAGPALPGLPGGTGLPAPPSQQLAQTQPQPGVTTLDQLIGDIQHVDGLAGRVFVVGQIVSDGQTAGRIGLAITDPADRQTLDDGLPQYRGRLAYHVVRQEPVEPHVEATPGGNVGRQGGSEQAVAALA